MREYTLDEVRENLLHHVISCIRYWHTLPGKNVRERLYGLAFSILVALDGEAGDLPGFLVIANPHPDDKGYHISGEMGGTEIFTLPNMWKAENKPYGLFIVIGPKIKKGKKVKNVQIIDIAPTILHLYGISIPKCIDGRILNEVFL